MASIFTIIANSHMIWCCWVVWQRRRIVVLLPAFIFNIRNWYGGQIIFDILYISFNWRRPYGARYYYNFTIVRVRYDAEGQLRPYRHFVEVLVESSAIPAPLYLAFILRDSMGVFYLDSITNVTKGIAPTLFVGCAAAGHTWADDSLQESVVLSLYFQRS
ncbi:uncharacterized protein ARMOST_22047 [Armillaria ostoyae]|uniref:Uncharacterized protein n=1 Tax=Armillaria ostoyae TaxID=47428 RepID=A0A284SBR9_ARMOS|nr:uncharacterized protein ARMOST_22047 [Armillaria ostoyae]